jgi:UPF0716 protein FxsA
MRILTILFLLFVTVPLVELAILIKVSDQLGLGSTIALILITGALGAWLAREQGLVTWLKIQRDMQMGILPSGRLVDGILIFVAGVVLITPGLLTDAVGFALLIPPIRMVIKRKLRAWFERKIQSGNVSIHFGP